MDFDVAALALEAAHRIREQVRETPVETSTVLSRRRRCRAHLKLENFQVTGSFKVRGAFNKLLTLTPEERRKGVVAASSGNHGKALAHALRRLGCPGLVAMPESASPAKVRAINELGVDVRLVAGDPVLAEHWARTHAEETGKVYVSPYNDPLVVGGQGTVGVELSRQLERVHVVYVAVGGGGLISGVAGYLRSIHPDVEIVACSPQNSPVMVESIRAGRPVDRVSKPTLSDGTAGGVEAGAITFDLCRRFVKRTILVEEPAIAEAMRLMLDQHHMLVEGAAGVAVAAFLEDPEPLDDRDVAIVVCGANVGLGTLRKVL